MVEHLPVRVYFYCLVMAPLSGWWCLDEAVHGAEVGQCGSAQEELVKICRQELNNWTDLTLEV